MTLSSFSIYVVFVDPHQGIKWCCALSLPTTKAYVEFIDREKARVYLQCIYCKVKQRIQRELSHTIKSRCACVWIYEVDICGGKPNSTLLLENLSLFWNLETLAREQGLSYSSFFSGGHLSTHCFRYFGHLSIFSTLLLFSSFFMNNFFIAPYLFSATKLWEIDYKNLDHWFGRWKT